VHMTSLIPHLLPFLAPQVYGFGYSEEFVGEYMRQTGTAPTICTKVAPLPW